MSPFNYPNQYGKEGVDHINISPLSECWMGKLIDPSYLKTVNYPEIGKFGSVTNLWYWLRSDPPMDAFRRASGVKLRMLLNEGLATAYTPNFRAIIAWATYEKLKAYSRDLAELKRLPESVTFLSYYIPDSTSLRVCSNYANVMVPIIDLIRKSLREGVEPDFASMLPDDADTSYCFLGPLLKQRFPAIYEKLQAANA